MMFAHRKTVPAEVITQEKKSLQAEYSSSSFPITSQQQQQQQQQQALFAWPCKYIQYCKREL